MTWTTRKLELQKLFARNHSFPIEVILNLMGNPKHLLHIGAMDAQSFDPISEYIDYLSWKVVFVEPQAHYASLLREKFKDNVNVTVIETAVSDFRGEALLYYVDSDAVKLGLVPSWAGGIASLYMNRNAIGGIGCLGSEFEIIKEHVRSREVKVCRLIDIYEQINDPLPNVLVIDAEGADYDIFKQLPEVGHWPDLLIIEIINLSQGETQMIIAALNEAGYSISIDGLNIVCFREKILM